MPADELDSSEWSREQDKQFENALVTYPDDTSDRWEKIAAEVSGKSVEEVKEHYDVLVDDVDRIESGFIKVPCYNSSSDAGDEGTGGKKGGNLGQLSNDSNQGGKCSKSDQERRKGIAWTEDEHRLFLLGLEKYGKGDWRSISRNFVVTRTPTQVASHAQKYFIRLNSMNKDRRRQSIHDITNVNNADASVPITGQANGPSVAASSSKSNKVGIFEGPPIGQPAVGTPVNPPHMTYGIGAPVTAPMNMGHMTYHPSGHR